MEKRVMGRPPAMWMYEVVKAKGSFNSFYSFIELTEMFNAPLRGLKKFCTSHEIEGKYEATEKGPVIRLVAFKDFQKKMKEHVAGYCR